MKIIIILKLVCPIRLPFKKQKCALQSTPEQHCQNETVNGAIRRPYGIEKKPRKTIILRNVATLP